MILDGKCVYQKFKIGILLAATLSLLNFVCLFSILGQQTLNRFFLLQFKHDFWYAGYFPLKQVHEGLSKIYIS